MSYNKYCKSGSGLLEEEEVFLHLGGAGAKVAAGAEGLVTMLESLHAAEGGKEALHLGGGDEALRVVGKEDEGSRTGTDDRDEVLPNGGGFVVGPMSVCNRLLPGRQPNYLLTSPHSGIPLSYHVS